MGLASQFLQTGISPDSSTLSVRHVIYKDILVELKLGEEDRWSQSVVGLGHVFGLSSKSKLVRITTETLYLPDDRLNCNRRVEQLCVQAASDDVSSEANWTDFEFQPERTLKSLELNCLQSPEMLFRRECCGFECREDIPASLKTDARLHGGEGMVVVLGECPGVVDIIGIGEKISRFRHQFPIVKVSCGKSHSLLLDSAGQILSVGDGSRGALGNGSTDSCTTPLLVEKLAGLKVKSIAAGGWHSGAITEFGDLYSWGWNESGQLGFDPQKTATELDPMLVELDDHDGSPIQVACGSRHTIILTDKNVLLSAGWNGYGQLGRQLSGPDQCEGQFRPVTIPLPSQLSHIWCEGWKSYAVETVKDLHSLETGSK